MNVVLIGYRCSGKTTAGKALAKKLKRAFIDTDDYLEKKFNTTISQIFKTRGEPYFRSLESNVIKEVSKTDNNVIATGGGAVLRHKNMHNLKRNGVIVFLDVSTQNAYKRLLKDKKGATKRPKLTSKNLLSEVKEQISFRYPYYKKFSDHVVRTDNKPISNVARNILKILKCCKGRENGGSKKKTQHYF